MLKAAKTEEKKIPKTVENDACDFSLIIPTEINTKILHWLNKTKHEVSGYGNLEWLDDQKSWRVKDVFLLKQEVSPTSTEIDPHAVGRAMFLTKDEPYGMKWHWHTHPNMGVFWSGDDMEIIRSHGQQDWILASVFNEKGEIRTAFYTKTEVLGKPHDVFVDEISTEVITYYPQEFFDQLNKEYEANVSELKRSYNTYYDGKQTSFLDDVSDHSGLTVKDYSREGVSWKDDMPSAPESKWSKLPEKLTFDQYGFARIDGAHGYLYNPCFDSSVTTEEEKFSMIEEMADWEINHLKRNCDDFARLLRKFILARAATKEQEGLVL